jgi:hypothetical protein
MQLNSSNYGEKRNHSQGIAVGDCPKMPVTAALPRSLHEVLQGDHHKTVEAAGTGRN